jgi:COMPASS component SWD3
LILGGSEDGAIYIWDIETGNILQKIVGHSDLVYSVASKKDLLASCSHDNTVATWGLST